MSAAILPLPGTDLPPGAWSLEPVLRGTGRPRAELGEAGRRERQAGPGAGDTEDAVLPTRGGDIATEEVTFEVRVEGNPAPASRLNSRSTWSGPGPPFRLCRLRPPIGERTRLAGAAGYSLSSHSTWARRNGGEDLRNAVTCAELVGSFGRQRPPPSQPGPFLRPQPGSSGARR